MRKIKKVVIHCTDSDDSLDIGFRQINDWHKINGWMSPSGISCGYHWIVRRDGRVEKGRPEEEKGAHVKGHNSDSIGIVWVGKNKPDPYQVLSLLKLTRRVLTEHKLGPLDVYGHYELDGRKTCPNMDMDWFRAEVLFTRD